MVQITTFEPDMNTLHNYFSLQWTFVKRYLTEFGVHPFVGLLLMTVGFVGISAFLFYKTVYAPYVLVMLAWSWLMPLATKERNDFLTFTYPRSMYSKIRFSENIGVVVPFIAIMLFYSQWWMIALFLVMAIGLVFMPLNNILSFTIPTPFGRRPFEFTVGFRQSFLVIGLAYFLLIMTVEYNNFNLGIFALILIFLVSMTYYSITEQTFYVWVHHQNVKQFLATKIITALGYSTLLAVPILVTMSIYFSDQAYIVIGVFIVGYVYLLTVILAKYSHYPSQIQLPQSIILSIGLVLPFLLVIIIPYFYKLTYQRLKPILQ
jgi:hypothetical protein